MLNFSKLNDKIPSINKPAEKETQMRWDSLAKPIGSLGELETLVTRIVCVSGEVCVSKRAVVVLAADNGVTAHDVSSVPSGVTVTMAKVIAEKQSAVCVMAKSCGSDVILLDMGMLHRVDGIDGIHIADGTADIAKGAAMTVLQAETAIKYGIELVKKLKSQGYKLLATGEMGIGNTTTSSAIAAVLLGEDAEKVTGTGAGIDDIKLNRKIEIIKQAIKVNEPDKDNAFDVLMKLGGFDIAGMVGIFIGGALCNVPIIIDGFISGVSALVAAKLCPKSAQTMIPSHISAEPAVKMVMAELGLKPIINANMRLGEGTGAVALIPILDMAITVYNDLPTLADIGVPL
jgi:nicotinate-nucleotide--dimethylbenzimidazole phosphoribosyltransferase